MSEMSKSKMIDAGCLCYINLHTYFNLHTGLAWLEFKSIGNVATHPLHRAVCWLVPLVYEKGNGCNRGATTVQQNNGQVCICI